MSRLTPADKLAHPFEDLDKKTQSIEKGFYCSAHWYIIHNRGILVY
ncbi:hypothetical protein TREAZ_3363 [Leadbettera azotonutricia ZAS-9]|uniref:Uncharacterized protein n=1 Tax=Leadbettera azotonutricia (strain ATCC BAA-888 / DSM 13862 / ZAS-9) TaxID=545695 RepID=F5Y8F7_LEAAZ|nr:hypothetical protein TREAZ_3363 [Leadbettera azotonutricia ZAS-9]